MTRDRAQADIRRRRDHDVSLLDLGDRLLDGGAQRRRPFAEGECTASTGEPTLYVYAIADTEPPAAARGLHGSRLRSLPSGHLVAVIGEHAVFPEPDEAELWAHETVVEKLMSTSTVLPMRFGTTVGGTAILRALITAHQREFEAVLGRVRGAVELSVRAQLPEAPEPAPVSQAPRDEEHPGTTYLLDRARRVRHGEELAKAIHRPLASLARESAPHRQASAPATFRAAYLVDEENVAAFGEAVDSLSLRLSKTTISCTGPWPPYSFVAGEDR